MSRRNAGRSFALGVTLCVVTMTGLARAQEPPAPAAGVSPAAPTPAAQEEARIRFNRALALVDDGDFDAARLELERAYELAPSYRILYNVGLVDQQLKKYASAYDAFDRYLREGGAEVPAERVQEVSRRIAHLKERVAYLLVTSSPSGADVFVDDVPSGQTPFPSYLRVNSGQRRVSVKVPGKPSEVRVVELAGGEQRSVAFDLNATAAATPTKSTLPYVAWGLTGAITAAAVTTGILALTSTSHYDTVVNTPNTTAADVSSAWNKAHTFALTTDVLTGVAIAAAGASLYFTLRPSARTQSPKTGGITVLPGVVFGTF
jgi:hypothetical protein